MAPKPKTEQPLEDAPEQEAPEQEAPERVFRLREGETTRVSVGSDPRVSIGPSDRYATRDEAVAVHLAATAELEEEKA